MRLKRELAQIADAIMICFTDSIPEIPPKHLHYVVIAANPISIRLLAKWLYDKFKNKPDEQRTGSYPACGSMTDTTS
jgi:hypothetical protein